MLREWWTYLRTDSVAGAASTGLKKEAPAIEARYRRHAQAWQPHLDRTKAVIKEAVQAADPAEPILILGAGALLDIPLDSLNAHPAGALLMDAVLLPSARQKLKAYPNIRFELYDVTGMLAIWAKADDAETLQVPAYAPIPIAGYSLIISCNLLSQLSLPFGADSNVEYLLESAHTSILSAAPCPAILISDFQRTIKTGATVETEPTFSAGILDDQEKLTGWEWHLAPTGETGKDKDVTLHVGVWKLS
ncbi:hypothetical protein GCM10017044_09480 [Kordiimonas sediminis]|uniref:Uncharacterized protein n=1 Tax=Kordiimonas sediminis TaxID=1735581 RepID=A0A919E5X9_9PROT|nr:hypothetical protein GCM10017044_09480 [Kordiimonas sediminis]